VIAALGSLMGFTIPTQQAAATVVVAPVAPAVAAAAAAVVAVALLRWELVALTPELQGLSYT
jgi:hypothetical protein